MWCKQCQQDVPAVPAAETDTYSCPRCGVELCGGSMPPASEVTSAEPLPPAGTTTTRAFVREPLDPPRPVEHETESVAEPAFPAEPLPVADTATTQAFESEPLAPPHPVKAEAESVVEPAFPAEPLPVADTAATQAFEPVPLDPPRLVEHETESVVEPAFPAEPLFVTESVCAAESVFVTETAMPSTGGNAAPEQMPPDAVTDQPPSFDGWELDEELRHIQRILAVEKPAAAPARSPMDFYTRLDPGHRTPSGWVGRMGKPAVQRQDSEATTIGWLSALISIVLSTGLMAFAFGGVLLVWSFVTGRQDLWTFGMPIAMAGQIVLLMGFILQMDRLWHDNRSTAAKLEHVDERLDDLRSNAERLGGSHRSAPPSNYGSPMAGSLDSQLMLADLKSQLDLLALKMGNQNDS